MNKKSIAIKLLIVLFVAVLAHSVFWFFKTGQIEKHINNFVAENGITVAEIKVSGYPFVQKIILSDLKFMMPISGFGKHQIMVKNLEASSSIFDANFTVTTIGKISVQMIDGAPSSDVEFSQSPQISFVVENGIISHFNYSDNGFRVFGGDKNVTNSASATKINYSATIDNKDQINVKLFASVKEIDGFNVIDLYKNSLEKRIVDGLKTGEISLGGGVALASIGSDPSFVAANGASASVAGASVAAPSVQNNAANAKVAVAASANNVSGTAVVATVPVATSNPSEPSAANAATSAPIVNSVETNNNTANNGQNKSIDAINSASKDNNNILIDVEYSLVPTKNNEQIANIPFDHASSQDSVVSNDKIIKVNNIELSNQNYKISINGQVNYFQDDNLPSGFVTIKVENFGKLTNQFSLGLSNIANQKADVNNPVQSAALSVLQPQNSYQDFVRVISTGLENVSKELANKNQLSKDDIAVFEMRREKNLEFVINETPLREVLGKF